MHLNELSLGKGAKKKGKRFGRGHSAGQGKTCVLRGTSVVLNDQSDSKDLSQAEDALGFLIDMTGPAAEIFTGDWPDAQTD